MRHRARLVVTLLTVLIFSVSMVGHAFVATQAVAKPASSMVNMEMDGADEPMGCGGDIKAHAACVATCAGGIAILCSPLVVPTADATRAVTPCAEVPSLGWGIPPEPHPPKRAIPV
jgi:hypothetical protein